MATIFKKLPLVLFLFASLIRGLAQEGPLTIEACYQLAKQHYPAAIQQGLLRKTAAYTMENASKGRLPQIAVSGQASYQSDVTEIPLKMPGVEIPVPTKDQYRLYTEMTQLLYDGGNIRNQQQAAAAREAVETQHIEVELYQLRERINQLFFGILMIDEQLRQNALFVKDIGQGLGRIKASISNGTALQSGADVLTVELIKAGQRATELAASRTAYLDMLGLFTNRTLKTDSAVLVRPSLPAIAEDIRRPELLLYTYQSRSLDIRNRMLVTANLPKLTVFLQAGVGKPALNLLSNQPEGYYIGGLRLNWQLGSLYTIKKERTILENERKGIEARKATFLFNTNLQLRQQDAEINKLRDLLAADDEIILLRAKIKNTAAAQLEFGTIMPTDYLREVNAEDQARQAKILHEIQLLLAHYNYKTVTGN